MIPMFKKRVQDRRESTRDDQTLCTWKTPFTRGLYATYTNLGFFVSACFKKVLYDTRVPLRRSSN